MHWAHFSSKSPGNFMTAHCIKYSLKYQDILNVFRKWKAMIICIIIQNILPNLHRKVFIRHKYFLLWCLLPLSFSQL